MNDEQRIRVYKLIVKSFLTVAIIGAMSLPFLTGSPKDPGNPLSHEKITEFDSLMTQTFEFSSADLSQDEMSQSLLDAVPDFVKTPEGGVTWSFFGQTKQVPYNYMDDEGMEWSGVTPEFTQDLKNLDGKEVLIQGYMFPLDQEEEQKTFLFGPFPMSCPFHYHVTPNLIIEAHAKEPVEMSYDAIDLKGTLELVPKDDEYNVFYRLKEARMVR